MGVFLGNLVGGRVSHAQSRFQTQRPYVPSPHVLGRGNAGVAIPHAQAAFFYNPAHLYHVDQPHVLMGLQGTFSTQVADQVQFIRDQLEPALDQGFESLSDEELRNLYDDALNQGYRPTTVEGAVRLPTAVWSMGPVGAGVGLFATSDLTYRFGDAGLGIPFVDLVGRTDVMARAGAGADLGALGLPGLAVGLMGHVTRRYFTFKNKPLDAIDAGDDIVLLDGTSLGVDLGLLYEPSVFRGPGRLTLGAALYDLQTTGFDYTFYGPSADWPVFGGALEGDDDGPTEAQVDRAVRTAREQFDLDPSYRLGIAYQLHGLPMPRRLAITVDYLGYESSLIDQSLLTHLHAGVEAQVVRRLALRAGLSQGYPTAGVGIEVGPVSIDYAFYGVEHGRFPGQMPSYQHNVHLAVVLY